MNGPSELATRHLALRLRPLARALAIAVERQASLAGKLQQPDVTPLCITGEQVNQLLVTIDAAAAESSQADAWAQDEAERVAERELRTAAQSLGVRLPMDALREHAGLTEHETRALLVCAAPEVERSYERVYAYVLDDISRRFPCVELITQLCAHDWNSRLGLQAALSHNGTLRRLNLLRTHGDAPTTLRQQLQCTPGLVEFLVGANFAYVRGLRDPEDVRWAGPQPMPPGDARSRVERMAIALRTASLDCVGLWGTRPHGLHAALQLLSGFTGRSLRRCAAATFAQGQLRREFVAAEERAAALNALLWIDLEGAQAPALTELEDAIESEAAQIRAPLVISSAHAWRPLALLQSRRYSEVVLTELDRAARSALLDGLGIDGLDSVAEDLAGRYRFGPEEAGAFANVLRSDPTFHDGGVAAAAARAAALVTHRGSSSYASVIEPRRQASELVLPEEMHREVLQIADFYRAWPRVREDWKLDKLAQGGGVKALFTGDSGTGKTLAAEVIASSLEAPLMKVELSQVVSKWVGVTEQQLDCVFREAHAMRAVLFFDEADALFGKRGEVENGVDRYANMEVSYLLQKLEDPNFSGLVLFATNLKDNIDQAFTRRFQFVLNFPRPNEADRQRIWRLALPEQSRLASGVDLNGFARLDMTGASIVAAARTAALLAASAGANEIDATHIVSGIRRQFRGEARMLLESDFLRPGHG